MRDPVLYRIVETIKAILLPAALAFGWGMPLFLPMQLADPIDNLPYFECFGAGIFLGVALPRGLVVLARKGVPGLTSFRVWDWVPMTIMCTVFMPPWAVFLGLGANRWLDHSLATEHLTQTRAWELSAKARARCRVTSWRGRASEEVTDQFISAAEATSPEREVPGRHGAAQTFWIYPRACVPLTPLIVASHPGALGWEWIERVRVPEPSDH